MSIAAKVALRATDGRITQEVWEHPLFQAVRDLESRLGMAEALAGSGHEVR